MSVKLRPATPEDIPVLQHWDAQPHVIAATGSDDSYVASREVAPSLIFVFISVVVIVILAQFSTKSCNNLSLYRKDPKN